MQIFKHISASMAAAGFIMLLPSLLIYTLSGDLFTQKHSILLSINQGQDVHSIGYYSVGQFVYDNEGYCMHYFCNNSPTIETAANCSSSYIVGNSYIVWVDGDADPSSYHDCFLTYQHQKNPAKLISFVFMMIGASSTILGMIITCFSKENEEINPKPKEQVVNFELINPIHTTNGSVDINTIEL